MSRRLAGLPPLLVLLLLLCPSARLSCLEQPESEALSSVHPEAVRAYLGSGAPIAAVVVALAPKPDDKALKIREHLTQAVALRVLAQDLGEPVYRDMMHQYARRGFPYLEALGERLKEYEASRGRYAALKDFYPRLEAVFREKLPEGSWSAPEGPPDELRRLKDMGAKDFTEGRYADAAEKFAAALKRAPRDAEAFLSLGVVYEKLGRKDEALESYGRAVDLSDGRSPGAVGVKAAALSSRAALLRERGRSP